MAMRVDEYDDEDVEGPRPRPMCGRCGSWDPALGFRHEFPADDPDGVTCWPEKTRLPATPLLLADK
jgi:hypothetical protein